MASEPESLPYYEPSIPFAEQKSEVRARFSVAVGQKLDSTPGLWRHASTPDRPIQLYVGDNFMNAHECELLCRQIDAGCYPSPLYEKEKYEGVRTSQTCNLNAHDPLVGAIEARISNLLGIDKAHGETLQGQRYEVGQQFKDHADFFYVDQPYWAQYEPQGGQRTWTAMVYLNQPGNGGATGFTLLGMRIEPRVGRILIWNNMALNGSPNPWTLHCGQPVDEGIKYIVTKWYRERHFC